MRILFTGFDPFGGEKINPAGEAVKMMKNEIQGAEILKLEVPTVFGKAGEVLKKAVEQYRPDAVVCVGQAGGRAAITPENSQQFKEDAVQYRKDHPELPLRKAAENLGVSLNTVEKRKEIING